MLGTGNYPNTSRKAVRHGHQGNVKKWQVQWRDSAEIRAEKKEFGCTKVDDWNSTPPLRLTQAERLIDRLEVGRCECKLINLNKTV